MPSKRKLTDEQAEQLRQLYYSTNCSMQRVGDHFGVSPSLVNQVLMRRGAYAEPKKENTPTPNTPTP